MTDSKQDTSDDISCFCIGDKEEGFRTSESVYDSDISVTDSEADDDKDDDDGYWFFDNESANQKEKVHERMVADSEHDAFDDISLYVGKEKGFFSSDSVYDSLISVTNRDAADDDGYGWFLDNECVSKSVDESMVTGLTMACSEIDTLEDASFYIGDEEEGFCILENSHDNDVSEIDSGDDDDDCNDLLLINDCAHQGEDQSIKKPLSRSISSDTLDTVLSSDSLDTILYHPIYLSALLTIMAHRPSKRDSTFSKTLPCSQSQEEIPTM
mmetsp:Transcript_11421/g.20087  ORF Transcript_11421/g.20087 Transcript_11421/m.20087 type:complete len:269 (+) Transcript_11421:146-952(+)